MTGLAAFRHGQTQEHTSLDAGRGGDGRAAVHLLELRLLSRERIEQAKADWKAGRLEKVPGDEHVFILPPAARGRTRDATPVSEGSSTT